jgi:hypothetical protein
LPEGGDLELNEKALPNDNFRLLIVIPGKFHPDGRKSYPIFIISDVWISLLQTKILLTNVEVKGNNSSSSCMFGMIKRKTELIKKY